MSNELVTVAAFDTAVEADLVKSRLEAEGIPACLADDATVGWFWYVSNAVGGIKVQVTEEHLDRALAILQTHREEAEGHSLNEEDLSPDAEADLGPEADGAELFEPGQGAQAEDEFPVPSAGDELAKYALRAAVLGLLLCPPLLQIYSVWLLFRLALFHGDLSANSMRKGLLALVIDTMVITAVVLVIRSR